MDSYEMAKSQQALVQRVVRDNESRVQQVRQTNQAELQSVVNILVEELEIPEDAQIRFNDDFTAIEVEEPEDESE